MGNANPWDWLQQMGQAAQGGARQEAGQLNTPAGLAAFNQQQLRNRIPLPGNPPRTPMQPGGRMQVGPQGNYAGGQLTAKGMTGPLNAYRGPAAYFGPDKKMKAAYGMNPPKPNATTWDTGANAKAAVTKQLARYTTNRQGQTVDPLTGAVVQPPPSGVPGPGGAPYSPPAPVQGPGTGGSPWQNLPPWVQPPSTDPSKDPRTMAALDIYDTRAKESRGALDQRLINMGLAGGVAGQALARHERESGLGRAALLGQLGESNRGYGLDVARLGLGAQGQGFNQGATMTDQWLAYQKFLADQDYRNRQLGLQQQQAGGGLSMWLNH